MDDVKKFGPGSSLSSSLAQTTVTQKKKGNPDVGGKSWNDVSRFSFLFLSSRESLSFTLPSFFSAKKMESRLYYCFLRLLLLILLLKSCAEPDESLLKAVEETRLSSIVVIETREEAVAKNREVRILSVEKELDVTDCSLFFLQFPSS